MKYKVSDIKNLIFLTGYQSTHNIKRMCSLVGFTNIMTCILFYYWIITISHEVVTTTYILASAILTHTYLNIVLIKWTLPYENAKWMKWAWASLISVSPTGIMLIYAGSNEKAWSGLKKEANPTNTVFHSLTNSSINLSNILNKAIEFLNTNHHQDFQTLLKAADLNMNETEGWPDKAKYVIIAIHEALKSKKNKGGFKDITFGAHWYDQRYFDFAIQDPKSLVVPNIRYKYSIGFVVLDEFNNYQKILDGKKEIKANMKFGPAKAVCLHWGKGFKIYVNE